jgi:uncharacterized protein YcbK (DUF882 family)
MAVDHQRRRFLAVGSAALLCAATKPALGAIAPVTRTAKALRFDNLHTGEKLSIEYWADGGYVPDALTQINYLLRDFRNGEVHTIDPKLLDLLHVINARLDTPAPFEVISGYRSPATNAMLHEASAGVAVKSLHMQGMAIDIRVPGRALSDLHATAMALQAGGVGYYRQPDFVHVDVGRVRYWGKA